MLKFEGDRDFSLPPAAVWVRLCDGRFLIHCIPDVASVTRAEPLDAEFVIRPGLAFVRGNLHTTLKITDAVPENTLCYVIHSKGIGSQSAATARLELTPTNGGTRIHWTCEITELGGLLKAVPKGVIQAAAQKVIGDVWAGVEARIEPPAAT